MQTPSVNPARAGACTSARSQPPTTAAKPARQKQCGTNPRTPFPDLPDIGAGTPLDFWLAAWARETAKSETLTDFNALKTTRKACDKNERLLFALFGSEINLRHGANLALKELHHLGGLLFAFAETAKLKGGTV